MIRRSHLFRGYGKHACCGNEFQPEKVEFKLTVGDAREISFEPDRAVRAGCGEPQSPTENGVVEEVSISKGAYSDTDKRG